MCDERQSCQGRESARLFIADCFQQEHTPLQGKRLIAKLETLACEQDAATSSDLANYLVLLLSSSCCLFQTRLDCSQPRQTTRIDGAVAEPIVDDERFYLTKTILAISEISWS